MKKPILFLCLSLFALINVNAQENETKADSTDWKYKFKPGLSYSSTAFKNYIAGGEELVTLKFNSIGSTTYTSGKYIWKNNLMMDYGFTKKRGQKVKVNVDKLDFNSRLSLINSNKSFVYTAFFGLKSQFTDGYNYLSATQWLLQSSFFSPGYVTLNVGIDYIKPEHLNIHLSPISEKTTIVREAFYDKKVINEYWDGFEPAFYPHEEDHMGGGEEYVPTEAELAPYEAELETSYESYGLAWRENVRFEVGSNVIFDYDNPELFKFVGLKSRLDLFFSYSQILKPDFDWETWISLNINDYFAFNINLQLAYDYDIKFQENYIETDGTPAVRNVPKLQFRNYLGFGVSYTFK